MAGKKKVTEAVKEVVVAAEAEIKQEVNKHWSEAVTKEQMKDILTLIEKRLGTIEKFLSDMWGFRK